LAIVAHRRPELDRRRLGRKASPHPLRLITMKPKSKRNRAQHNARVLQELYVMREGLHGIAARDYMDRYIQLKAQAFELEKRGLKVRISLPDFPGRPLLVIEK